MADVRIRYSWVWIVFIAVTLTGAGLMTSQDLVRVRIGIALLVAPWVLLSLLLAVYYINSRTRAMLDTAGDEDE